MSMSESTAPVEDSASGTNIPGAAPTGFRAKAAAAVGKAYEAAPPPAQKAFVFVVTKVVPPITKAAPHAKKALGGLGVVLVARKLKRRKG
jgi:hypothetical protein